MGRKLREYEWGGTSLGLLETWPQSLRVAVRILLASSVPIALWWGKDLVQIHNDAYRASLGSTIQSHLFGTSRNLRTDRVWETIGPSVEAVLNGRGPISGSGIPLSIENGSVTSPVYWDFSLCPIDVEGDVGGVLGFVRNVSEEQSDDEVLDRTSKQLLRYFENCPGFICIFSGPEHVYEFVNSEYRLLMGERNYIGQSVRLVVPEVANQGFFAALDTVFITGETYVGRNVLMRYQNGVDVAQTQIAIDFIYKALVSPSGDVYGIFVEGTPSGKSPLRSNESSSQSILTMREREVLGWIALGKTASYTANVLHISKRTCESHIYSATKKLGAANSIQAVVEAIRLGELPL